MPTFLPSLVLALGLALPFPEARKRIQREMEAPPSPPEPPSSGSN